MNKVHLLAPEVISKIAAGEVIERPSSVIKELLENSLDAASTAITIDLAKAGKTGIRILDNGSGIEAEDIDKICARHATSKLSTIDDLEHILSFGFRGEALYSIAAVSDIIIRSKTLKSETGWEMHQRGGKIINRRPVQMNPGTEIIVNELFFNTPARKKFLKTDSSEISSILDVIIPYVLLYPSYRYVVSNNEKNLITCEKHESRIHRTATVLNLDKSHLVEIKKEIPHAGITIHLILGDINIQRPRKDLQYIFINNRPVQNRTLQYQINQAYRSLFPPETNPFFILFLTLPAKNIDVNIHPTKREVKIRDEYALAMLVKDVCGEALKLKGKARQITITKTAIEMPPVSDSLPKGFKENVSSAKQEPTQYIFTQPVENSSIQEPVTPYRADTSLKTVLSQSQYIGCFLKKYLLFETSGSLLLMDQHAAHERINFEAFKKQIEKGTVEVQQLLSPILIKLSPEERVNWEDGKEKLDTIGLMTTQWDKNTIGLHAHPLLIKNPEFAIRNLLAGEKISRCDTETLARKACRSSVMTGERIHAAEAENLRKLLLQCSDPFTCPHGRPTVVELPEKQLAKYFLRGS